jgi:hypothetical protein
MAGILAIEADRSRRMLLKALIREHVHGEVMMVDSVKAAIASFSRYQPDLIVAPALLSPADSAELAAHVKTQAGPHVQMVTISALDVLEQKRRMGFFRRQTISLGLQYDPQMVGRQIANALEEARLLRAQYASGFRIKTIVEPPRSIVGPVRRVIHAPTAAPIAQPDERERRCAKRIPQQGPGQWTLRMPWGTNAELVNISRTGVLIASGSKVTPGVTMELQLSGLGLQRIMTARFVRSEIAHVDRLGVRYHAAAQFEQPLDILPAHGESTSPSMSAALSQLLSDVLSDGNHSEAPSVRFARGVRGLLNARDVVIRRAPIAPVGDTESIYFNVSGEGDVRTILQVMFERDHAVTAAEFRLLKAASVLTAGVLELEELSVESARLAGSHMLEVA